MKTIAVASVKGGCGKSTLSIHIAVAASLKAGVVVIVDLDPQASTI
ncbi:ParA family protein [Nostoc sp.]